MAHKFRQIMRIYEDIKLFRTQLRSKIIKLTNLARVTYFPDRTLNVKFASIQLYVCLKLPVIL